jgi:hypothetical protein
MEKFEIVLYGAAIYLAIKSLVSLMTDHARTARHRLARELAAARRAAAAAAAQAAPAVAPAAGSAPNAAKPERPVKKAG